MLVFGHAGITLGAAVVLNGVFVKRCPLLAQFSKRRGQAQSPPGTLSPQNSLSAVIVSWLTSLADRIDIRLLLIGSLLPDIIDKPVGMLFFRDTFSNGQIFSHTLLFFAVITLGGLCLYRRRDKTWLLVLSFGTFTHLILDAMWRKPRTLLWPLYGFSFEKIDLTNWLPEKWHIWLTEPTILISEFVGAVVVISFLWLLVRRGKPSPFLRTSKHSTSYQPGPQ